MRWFWIAVLVLLVAAIAAVAWQPRAPRPPLPPSPIASRDPEPAPPPPAESVAPAIAQPATQPGAASPVLQPPATGGSGDAPAEPSVGPPAPVAEGPAPAEPNPLAETNPLAELAGAAATLPAPAPSDARATLPEPAPASPLPPSASAEPAPFAFPDDPAFGPDRWVDSKAVRRADGAVLLDDRFVVRGSGTAEDPYRVTWELLASAQEVYKPRAGQKKLPRRVTFLHNKYVRITGFVAFPIASNNPRECLVMLNQWDGCCIGIPPTAFDAVEVRLKKAATGEQRLLEHGELQGKFKVDPFEDGGWLLSLYLLDDATLKGDH